MTEPTNPALPATSWTGDDGGDDTVNNWGITADAAEYAIKDGIDGSSFASVFAPAWHRLGVYFEQQVSASTLLVTAGADYEVFTGPIETTIDVPIVPGSPITVPKRATDPTRVNLCRFEPVPGLPEVRGKLQILGQASRQYQIINNRPLFVDFADALMDAAGPTASTCGVLFGGREAFMSFKLPQEISVGGSDETELWLTAHTSHDGSRKATLMISPIRAVCQNTLRVASLQAVSRWAIKHTSKATLRLQEAREALKLAHTYAEEWAELADDLVETEMTTGDFEIMCTKLWGPGEDPTKHAQRAWDEKFETLVANFAVHPAQENVRRTAWAGFNAVTQYVQHDIPVRGVKVNPEAAQFWRALDGSKTTDVPAEAALSYLKRFAGIPA